MSNPNASPTPESGLPRFAILDAMRGVAILAVACYHLHGVLTHDGKLKIADRNAVDGEKRTSVDELKKIA